MGRSIGVLATGHLWAGIVDGAKLEDVKMYPKPGEPQIDLKTIPAGDIVAIVCDQVRELAKQGPIESVGAGFPGVIRGGVILESPNLGQLKGFHVADELRCALGAGGIGHLEGIMGHRAMRLRFLDMEPEEVFVAARQGDQRAGEFLKLWHRALAAGTANSIHLDGPGRFYVAGPNADFLDIRVLGGYLQEMVKMSPLQGSYFQIVPTSHDMALIGSAVASRAK